MEKIRHWVADVFCWVVSLFCYFSEILKWFTPAHCEHISQIIAMIIGAMTLFFITIPRALPNMRKFFKKRSKKK